MDASRAAPSEKERVLALLESKPRKRISVDDIEAKLKEASLRRQQFHAWVASKAKSKRMTSAVPRRSSDSLADGDCSITGKGTVNSEAALDPEAMLQRLYSRLEAAAKKREELEMLQRKRQEKNSKQRQLAASEARQRQEAKAAEIEQQREGRVEKAESNRAAILEAEKAKRAAVRKRVAKLRARRAEQEWRDHQRALKCLEALGERLRAAEKKRQQRIDAERERLAALTVQARHVAESVLRERESELEKRRERLEAKVAQARCRRAELLSHRGGCTGTCHKHGHRKRLQWELLSKKVARCWRAFRGSNKTSVQLAQAYLDCQVTVDALKDKTFDNVAMQISSPETISAAKALLDRLLLRLLLVPDEDVATWQRQVGSAPCVVKSRVALPKSNVDQLLEKLLPKAKKGPSRRQPFKAKSVPPSVTQTKRSGVASANSEEPKHGIKDGVSRQGAQKAEGAGMEGWGAERYPVRPFLSAYMVVLHPDAVMTSTSGETSQAVRGAASRLISSFEAVVKRLLGEKCSTPIATAAAAGTPATVSASDSGRRSSVQAQGKGIAATAGRCSSIKGACGSKRSKEESQCKGGRILSPFRCLLLAFDAAWVEFLGLFVEWKQEDERQLETDIIATACRLEMSMLRKCGDRPQNELSLDLQAIREGVAEDQRLLRSRILRLTGSKGGERFDSALHDLRMRASGGSSSTSSSCCNSGLSSSDNNSTSDSTGSAPLSPASSAASSPAQSPSISPARGSRASRTSGEVSSADGKSRAGPRRGRWGRGGSVSSRLSFSLPDPWVPLEPQNKVEGANVEGAKVEDAGVGAPSSAQEGEGQAPVTSVDDVPSRVQGDGILPEVVALVLEERLHKAAEQVCVRGGEGAVEGSPADVAAGQNPVEAQISSAFKSAFWVQVRESLLSSPPDTTKAESLLREWHAEMQALAPKSQPLVAHMLHASLEKSLSALQTLKQELSEASVKAAQGQAGTELLSLLEGATEVLVSMGAEAREGAVKQGLEDLKERFLISAREGGKEALVQGVVDGLAFLFENLEVYKRDVAVAPLMLLPSSEVVQILRASFAAQHAISPYPSAGAASPDVDLRRKLPRTWAWIEKHCTEASGPSEVTVAMRAGRGVVRGTINTGAVILSEVSIPGAVVRGVQNGVVELISQAEGVEGHTVAETLTLDVLRIRGCQDAFQRIVVSATGLLLVRQAVAVAGVPWSASLDTALEGSLPGLKTALAESSINAARLGGILGSIASSIAMEGGTVQTGKGSFDYVKLISSLLPKTLDPTATIFQKVSGAVRESLVMLLERGLDERGGSQGEEVGVSVQRCLKKGGAGALMGDVIGLSKRVEALCSVNVQVHGPLYRMI